MPESATFHIPAMDCPEEAALIERGLHRLTGVGGLTPDYLARTLRVEFDASVIDAGRIESELAAIGFPGEAVKGAVQAGSLPQHRISRSLIVGGLLLIAAALELWCFGMRYEVTLAAVSSAIFSGWRVAQAAYRALRLRAIDMNVLMTIAAVGAIAIGDVFEAATAMFLFGVALWLESFSLSRAHRAIRSLVELSPVVAHRLATSADAPDIIDVAPDSLAISDRILVRPGERLPIDGRVLEGLSSVNQATITGESRPVLKRPGDSVFAGTLNGEGSLTIEVTRLAGDTTLAHVGRLVEQARASRSPTERFVDRFAQIYTPVVLLLAAIAMVGPLVLAGLDVGWAAALPATEWLHRGLVLLVIACPCALVISTPVTVVSGLYAAAQHGILIKGGEHLENAAAVDCLAIDKTGTLTTGALEVVKIEPLPGHSAEEVLALAAALEHHSEHPLAAAVLSEASRLGLTLSAVEAFAAHRGLGVEGRMNGEAYYLGSERLFQQPGFELSNGELLATIKALAHGTTAWLGTRRRLIGRIQYDDRPRHDAARAIAELRRIGVRRIVMLTGDSWRVAQQIAAEVGISEVHAEMLPAEKIARVRQLAATCQRLAMVGDGVNDAPALAGAGLGIALGAAASDTALETADVVIMSPDLSRVVDLMKLGRRVRELLGQNIAIALGSKLAVLMLAAGGWATMWLAVAADVGASLVVIANGMRMVKR